MQGLQLRSGGSVLKGTQHRSISNLTVKAAAAAPASDAGNNVLGDSIRSTYGEGVKMPVLLNTTDLQSSHTLS